MCIDKYNVQSLKDCMSYSKENKNQLAQEKQIEIETIWDKFGNKYEIDKKGNYVKAQNN